MTVSPPLADQASLARHNRSTVLAHLRSEGPASRAAMAARLPLTKGTISVIVDELLRDGLAREVGTVTVTGPGRPARLIEYVASAHLVGAVHLGVATTHVLVADGLGRVVAESRLPTTLTDPDAMLAGVAEGVQRIAERAALPTPRSIAVCVPGHVDHERGVCVRAPNLGWRDVEVADVLGARLRAQIHVVNDAQAALLAERGRGAAAGVDDVALLYAGDGVSAALLSGGQLLSGTTGASGEIGHCPVPGGQTMCGCGRRGCLETVASSRGVVTAVHTALAGGAQSSRLRGRRTTIEDVLVAARDGDAVATRALRDAGGHLGRACGVLVNILNPRVVVLAGTLCRGGDTFVRAVRDAAADVALGSSWRSVEIRPAAFGEDAEVMGALLTALDNVALLEPDSQATA